MSAITLQITLDDENEVRALKALIAGAIDTENLRDTVRLQRVMPSPVEGVQPLGPALMNPHESNEGR